MEDAKRLASDMELGARGGGGQRQGQRSDRVSGARPSDATSSSRVGEIVAVVLRLTDDADFKIVRRNTHTRSA